jgi:hypothetical protein
MITSNVPDDNQQNRSRGIRTHDPSVRASEDSSCLRPRETVRPLWSTFIIRLLQIYLVRGKCEVIPVLNVMQKGTDPRKVQRQTHPRARIRNRPLEYSFVQNKIQFLPTPTFSLLYRPTDIWNMVTNSKMLFTKISSQNGLTRRTAEKYFIRAYVIIPGVSVTKRDYTYCAISY